MFAELPALRTVVKVPPTYTWLPITSSALTRPFWMFGVQEAGASLTIDVCGGLTAAAGTVAMATSATTDTSTPNRVRARGMFFMYTPSRSGNGGPRSNPADITPIDGWMSAAQRPNACDGDPDPRMRKT